MFCLQIPENIFNKMLKAWIVDDSIHKGDNIVYLVLWFVLYYVITTLCEMSNRAALIFLYNFHTGVKSEKILY